MATSVVNPRAQFFANNGRPLIGGRIHTYVAGSSTRARTYKDAAKAQPNTNPIILDGRGEAQIYLAEGVEYKFMVEDSKGALIYTQEPVYGAVWPNAAEWPSDATLSYQYMTEAKAAADAIGPIKFYDTYAQAQGDVANIPNDGLIEIFLDETRDGARTRYFKRAADVLEFVVNLDQLRLDLMSESGAGRVEFSPQFNYVVGTLGHALATREINACIFPYLASPEKANNSSAIQAAIDRCSSLGGGVVKIPLAGDFVCNPPLQPRAGVTIEGSGSHSTWLVEDSLSFMVRASGSMPTDSVSLTANAPEGTRELVVSDASAYGRGDWLFLVSDDLPHASIHAQHTQKSGEFVRVFGVSGNTVTLSGPTSFAHNTADNARVFKPSFLKNVGIRNIGFKSKNVVTGTRIFTAFEYCLNPRIEDCHFERGVSAGVYLIGCVNAYLRNVTGIDLASAPEPFYENPDGGYGYLICEGGPNIGTTVIGAVGTEVRHVYTTVTGGGTDLVQEHGVPLNSRISNSFGMWTRGAAFDTHPAGMNIRFLDCYSDGAGDSGFQIRTPKTKVLGGGATNSRGPAVYMTSHSMGGECKGTTGERNCLGTNPEGVDYRSWGAFADNGRNNMWSDFTSVDSSGPGWEHISGGGAGTEVNNPRIKNPCRAGLGTKAGIRFTASSTSGTATVRNPQITCSDALMDYGVHSQATGLVVNVRGGNVGGAAVKKYSLAAGGSSIRGGDSDPTGNSFGRGVVVTVAGGEINVENAAAGYLVVGGEGDLADDLATITGLQDGDQLLLRKNNPAITVKHNAGNIQLTGSADFVLANTYSLLRLVKIGTMWVEIGRRA